MPKAARYLTLRPGSTLDRAVGLMFASSAMTRRRLIGRPLLVAWVMLLVLSASPAVAIPGARDRSFSGNGVAFVRFGPTAFGDAAALDSVGRLVVAGSSNYRALLARLLPSGALDPSFGGDGKVRLPNGVIKDIALMPDGRIVGVGLDRDGWYVVMVTPSGEPDATFGTGGVAEVAYNDGGAEGVAVDPQGRVVAVGVRNDDAAVARYLPTGRLDPTFSGDGRRVVPLGQTGVPLSYDRFYDVALAPGGDLVVAGDVDAGSIGVVKLDDSGDLVGAFGDGGSVVQRIGVYSYGGSLLVEDDRIVVGAHIELGVHVLAYTGDGAPDATFGGGDGIVRIGPTHLQAQGTAIASTPAGGYVLAGAVVLSEESDVMVGRLDHDGVPDPTFTDAAFGAGLRIVRLPRHNLPSDVAVRPDGRIVVSGTRSGGPRIKMEILQLQG